MFSTGQIPFELQNTWILDPGADTHVYNNQEDFIFLYPAAEDDYLIAGGNFEKIQAYRTVTITVDTPTGKSKMKLSHVALVPTMFTNIVALSRATDNDIHFDSGRNLLYRLATGETVCYARRLGGYWALMHREPTLDSTTQSTFSSRRYQPSRMARKPVGATATKWHKILGHAGPDAIKQLPKHVNGAELELNDERAPLKVECEVCSISKHTQQISRRREHEHPATRPFERVAFDIITLGEPGYNGDRYVMHFYCTYSKFNFVFTSRNKDKATAQKDLIKMDIS